LFYFNFVSLQIDQVFISNLPEIVVELLMTLHETADSADSDASQSATALCDFSGYAGLTLGELAVADG
jgi:ataxia telangiectasia mutated family protein